MSNALGANVPAKFDSAGGASFIAADTTKAKILLDSTTAAAASGTSPVFYGGATVIDLTAFSSDSADKDIALSTGTIKTTQGAGTGVISTTSSTIVRASGSFITDGWRAGMQCMTFAPLNDAENAVDGIICTITGVTATTLTVNGTPLSVVATATSGTRIVQVKRLTVAQIPLGSGNSNSVGSAALLGSNSGTSIASELKLGANDMLIGSMVSAVSALPAVVTVNVQAAYY